MGKCEKNMIEGIAQRGPKKDVCHSIIVLEVYVSDDVVSTRMSRAKGEEEADRATTGGYKKKRDSKGEVYKKQETSEPCIYFS
jgi:hypothetical protein